MADLSISQVREKFPQYSDMSDEQLAQGLHKKYYSDMPFDAFSQKIGLKSKQETPYMSSAELQGQRKGYRARLAGVGEVTPETKGFEKPALEGGLGQQLLGVAEGAPLGLYSAIAGFPGARMVLPSGEKVAEKVYKPVEEFFGVTDTPAKKSGRESGMMLGAGPFDATLLRALGTTAGVVAKPFKYGAEIVSTARGKGAREAAEAIRGEARGLAEEKQLGQQAVVKAEKDRIAGLEDAEREVMQSSQEQLRRIGTAQEQIANREAIAAERAQRRAGTTLDEKGRVIGGQTMEQLRAAALTKTRDRVQSELVKAREAGLSEAEAASHLADTEGRVARADQAVQAIEQRIMSGERMAPEQFGAMLQNASRTLLETGLAAREKLSGFGPAIRSAGEALIVPTKSMSTRIEQIIKSARDPAIVKPLEEIKGLLSNGEGKKKVLSLSIEQADSLRKMLDRVTRTKQIQYANGTAGDAAAAIHHVSELKDDFLVPAAGNAHKPYKTALEKFRKLSRPLDIVQRKGALRKVVDVDSLSQDLLRGSAEIAGAVIRRAKEGHPVFNRLLEIDRNIKNGARAYFNRELFGRDRVPTTDRLRGFLQENEGVLRQLGLSEEFATIANARAAGERAVEAVKLELTQAKAGLKQATAAERAQQKVVSEAERVRSAAVKRQAEAEKAAVTPEKIATQAELRAKEAEIRLGKEARGVEKATKEAVDPIRSRMGEAALSKQEAAAKAEAIAKDLSDLSRSDPKNAVAKAKDIVNTFKKELSTSQYDDLMRQIQMAENAYGKTEKARAMIVKILKGVGIGGATIWGGGKILGSMIGD